MFTEVEESVGLRHIRESPTLLQRLLGSSLANTVDRRPTCPAVERLGEDTGVTTLPAEKNPKLPTAEVGWNCSLPSLYQLPRGSLGHYATLHVGSRLFDP